MLAAKLLGASGTAAKTYVDDVFSAYTYTGNGSTQTITNGIDLAGKGGMVWTKGRSGITQHGLYDTTRGATKYIMPNEVSAETTRADGITAFTSTGYSLGADAATESTNKNATTYVSWTFRNADKFYNHTTVVKTGGSNATVSFANLTTLGMVRVKRTDSTGSWYIWHRSLTAGKLLIGETTAAEATLGHITVSGTTVTLVNGVIADGTYLVEGFAHDTGTDGLIQCGSFTTDGSGNATVTLGWEPQFVLSKANDVANWIIADAARGMPVNSASSLRLNPNSSGAENTGNSQMPTATGFIAIGLASTVHFYLAIRRPNKPPTTGTQVYNAIARTGTGAAATVTGVGFAPDLLVSPIRGAGGYLNTFFDRLRGAGKLFGSARTDAEITDATTVTAFGMDGVSLGADSGGYTAVNQNTYTYINWFFKRAPGVMDVVCDTGTGAAHTVSHSLGAVPELMIRKKRSAVDAWYVYAGDATDYLVLNTTAATADLDTIWNDTAPTSTVFTVGTHDDVNASTATFVTYLFATLAGISKVGSYTGTATTNAINCGFTTGARFVMIKRTDSTGDWYVWDTTRGIIAGNDPYLLLNSTAAEVTGTDYIDPSTSGFELSSTAPAAINASGGTFIYLAFA